MARYPRRVIVGVDGSVHSATALTWAAADARLRGSELVAVTVCRADTPESEPGGVSPPGGDTAEQACRDMQAQLLRQLPADAAPRVTSLVPRGDPAEELTRIASARDLLVAGTRGRGRLSSLLLGSVAQGCAERARCPVVIIPTGAHAVVLEGIPRRAVVAGVDSSAAARQALHFAAEEAAARGVPLIPVHVVYPDYVPGPGPAVPAGAEDRDLLGPIDGARAQLDALIRSELTAYGVTVRPVVICGQPDRILLDWTESAALVVVGTRGAGRIHTALLGSVSTYLLQHGRCPVAVVPASAAPGRDPRVHQARGGVFGVFAVGESIVLGFLTLAGGRRPFGAGRARLIHDPLR